jgi:hypothetical protein
LLLRSHELAARSGPNIGDLDRGFLQGWAGEEVARLLLRGGLHAGVAVALRSLFVGASVHTAEKRILRSCKDTRMTCRTVLNPQKPGYKEMPRKEGTEPTRTAPTLLPHCVVMYTYPPGSTRGSAWARRITPSPCPARAHSLYVDMV